MIKRIVKKLGKRTDLITPGDIETAKRVANHMAVLQHGQFLHLHEFVAWARRRRYILPDAPINDETIEYVTQGIERFLKGENPWPKLRGNKPIPILTWEIYWLVSFDESYKHLHNKRHTGDGGLYTAVGVALNKNAKSIESQVRKAQEKLETPEGRIEFCGWVAKKLKERKVSYTPSPKKKAKSPKA